MGSVRVLKNNRLLLDFRYEGQRVREVTKLPDTEVNRQKLQAVLDEIESEIAHGTFILENYTPVRQALKRLASQGHANAPQTPPVTPVKSKAPSSRATSETSPGARVKHSVPNRLVVLETGATLTFHAFATRWFEGRSKDWRHSHAVVLNSTLQTYLLPFFGARLIGGITDADVLEFRNSLICSPGRGTNTVLSSKRINDILALLKQIMNDACGRFGFASPVTTVKNLAEPKVDVDPFTFAEFKAILATVREDYKDYLTVRFLTGLQTGEIHGLKWHFVDFERRLIHVRETVVLGEDIAVENSARDIQMSPPVFDALKNQFNATGTMSEYVFCNRVGEPLDNSNFLDRIWYPLLRHLGIKKRSATQMRHTAAAFWLASGEPPDWIATQLGNTSPERLVRVYSRHLPNLVRQEGAAMNRLLDKLLGNGSLTLVTRPGEIAYVPAVKPVRQKQPKPRGMHGKKPAAASATSFPLRLPDSWVQ